MADVVVTVPKDLWQVWQEEGDLPGDEPSGTYWSFYCRSGALPLQVDTSGPPWSRDVALPLLGEGVRWFKCRSDQRCYVVAHGRLRGYAPLYAIETDETARELRAFIRRAGAVAVTIAEPIRGFRGWRYRWWRREDEISFPEWRTEGV
jgi:hypothetical protein